MEAQKEAVYIDLFYDEMSPSEFRDILKISKIMGIAPALFFVSSEQIKGIEFDSFELRRNAREAVDNELRKLEIMNQLKFGEDYGLIIYSCWIIANFIAATIALRFIIKNLQSIRKLNKHDRSAAYVKLSIIGLWWYFLLFIPQKSTHNLTRLPFFITINNLNMIDFQRMIFELIIIVAIFVSVFVWRRLNNKNQ